MMTMPLGNSAPQGSDPGGGATPGGGPPGGPAGAVAGVLPDGWGTLLDASPLGIALGEQGSSVIVWANRAFGDAVEEEAARLRGRDLSDFLAHSDPIAVSDAIAGRSALDDTASREWVVRRSGAQDLPVEVQFASTGDAATGRRWIAHVHDLTDVRQADRARAASEANYRGLYENNPLMCFAVGRDGTVLTVNHPAVEQLGYAAEELIGHSVLTVFHPDDHVGVMHQLEECLSHLDQTLSWDFRKVRRDGQLIAVREHGRAVRLPDGEEVVYINCEDITVRQHAEDVARQLREMRERRQEALELNDNVVQGLTSALLALQLGNVEQSQVLLSRTVDSARAMMSDLLAPPVGVLTVEPDDLLRAEAVPGVLAPLLPLAANKQPAAEAIRVVIADDSPDLRYLLRVNLEKSDDFVVVGEAAHGLEAISVARDLQPAVVLLDLAMPVMDGLRAIPEIRRVSPESRIVVFSGFAKSQTARATMQLGADAYVEKATAIREIQAVVRDVCR